jgi:hypothetical protein
VGNKTTVSMARTNNAIERYNRTLKERFAHPHPNVFAFLNVIKEESEYFKEHLNNI